MLHRKLKGYIPIEIPTKRYIKTYIIAQMGPQPYMTQEHAFGCKLYDLIQHETNEEKKDFATVRYNERVKIYINKHVFNHRGAFINETNLPQVRKRHGIDIDAWSESIKKDYYRYRKAKGLPLLFKQVIIQHRNISWSKFQAIKSIYLSLSIVIAIKVGLKK